MRQPRPRTVVLAVALALGVAVPIAWHAFDPRENRVSLVNRSRGPVTDIRLDDSSGSWYRTRFSRLDHGATARGFILLNPDLDLRVTYRDPDGKEGRADARDDFRPVSMSPRPSGRMARRSATVMSYDVHVIFYDGYVSIVYESASRRPTLWEYLRGRLPW